jgi:hypothetical protein
MAPKTDSLRIRSRKELHEFLGSQMDTAYQDLVSARRLESESSLVKSYVLETDLFRDSPGPDHGAIYEFLAQRMLPHSIGVEGALRVIETDEEALFDVRYRDARREATLFIDASGDSRYWTVHTLSSATDVDWWLGRVVSRAPGIDFVWLWPSILELHQAKGVPRGFGLDYDYRLFEDRDEVTTYFKMQLWGGSDTQKVYELLKCSDALRGRIVLSKVRTRVHTLLNGDEVGKEQFTLQDLKFNGKFTARGTSFQTHHRLIVELRKLYASVVSRVEETYPMYWEQSHGGEQAHHTLEGYALNFLPSEGLSIPVDQFCSVVFSGSIPFRLKGFIEKPTASHAIVDAVDLHTGGRLGFEVLEDRIMLYLQPYTCGNTVVRFYTNLQHYFNVGFMVKGDDGRRPFELGNDESVSGAVQSG